MQAALTVVLQLLNITIAGAQGYEELMSIRSQVEQMVADGRDPTDEEWTSMLSSIQSLTSRLAAADERLNDPA